jgi:hypothetical protein
LKPLNTPLPGVRLWALDVRGSWGVLIQRFWDSCNFRGCRRRSVRILIRGCHRRCDYTMISARTHAHMYTYVYTHVYTQTHTPSYVPISNTLPKHYCAFFFLLCFCHLLSLSSSSSFLFFLFLIFFFYLLSFNKKKTFADNGMSHLWCMISSNGLP